MPINMAMQGCFGVVLNASAHPLPDNVKLTQKVVALAARLGVLVVEQVGQLENGAANTSTEPTLNGATSSLETKYFVEHTGVNCLVVSVSRISNNVGVCIPSQTASCKPRPSGRATTLLPP